MNILPAIAQGFGCWIDSIASTAISLLDSMESPQSVKLIEDESGHFMPQHAPDSIPSEERWLVGGQTVEVLPHEMATALSGKRVELSLRADRFLFRRLELPARALELLDGIVQAQIDRLTPWNARDAAFGWSEPTELGTGRISITIAATAQAWLMSYMDAIKSAGAHSITVFTSLPEPSAGAAPIKIWEGRAQSTLEFGRIRQALIIILAAAVVAAGCALGVSAIISAKFDSQQKEIVRRTGKAREAVAAARASGSSTVAAAQRTLERRKHDFPSSFVLLETLSQILPDHTYVTELRIEGSRLRLVGITGNAPSLIGAMEQSEHFTRATFFAPTTRSPSDPGERFHLEATIKPIVSPRS